MLVNNINSPDFNSYASLDECKSYAASRGLTLSQDDSEITILLINAMDYLDGMNWKGKPTNTEQPLSWPRIGVVKDCRQIPCDEIPKQLKEAQCYLAIMSQDNELLPMVEGGAEVLSESIAGAVSLTYASGSKDNLPKFPLINRLLNGLCYSSNTTKIVRG